MSNEIALTRENAQCLTEGGYVVHEAGGQNWRLVHESYTRPFPHPADRHVSLSAAEVDIIARMPEGLIVGDTVIRSEVTS
jgi:hypothetical protein